MLLQSYFSDAGQAQQEERDASAERQPRLVLAQARELVTDSRHEALHGRKLNTQKCDVTIFDSMVSNRV